MASVINHSEQIGVPKSFINGCMKEAKGEYVKVYLSLLLLAQSGGETDLMQALQSLTSCSYVEVQKALEYWEEAGVLQVVKEGREISRIDLAAEINVRPCESEQKAQQTEIEVRPCEPEQKNISQHEEEVRQLMFVAEKYLNRPLSRTDSNTLLYFLNDRKFSPELCEYLVEYCVSRGHNSIHYIEKVGINWHEEGVTTKEAAEKVCSLWTKYHYAVLKAFGISGRNPIPAEVTYMERWKKEYGFSIDIISEACARSLKKTGRQSFEYAEGILKRWKDSGVKTIADIEKADKEYKESRSAKPAQNKNRNKFHNFEQRDDDLSAIEQAMDRQFADQSKE